MFNLNNKKHQEVKLFKRNNIQKIILMKLRRRSEKNRKFSIIYSIQQFVCYPFKKYVYIIIIYFADIATWTRWLNFSFSRKLIILFSKKKMINLGSSSFNRFVAEWKRKIWINEMRNERGDEITIFILFFLISLTYFSFYIY